MTHRRHRIDRASRDALASTDRERDHFRIRKLLIARPGLTARQVSRRTRIPLVTCRARLSDGCRRRAFRKVERVEERESACRVWQFKVRGRP